jgi:protein-disulfide isomerase
MRFAAIGVSGLAWLMVPPAAWSDEPAASVQSPAIEAVIRQVLHDHPELVTEAIKAVQAKDKATAEARVADALVAHDQEIQHAPTDQVLGNPQGDVSVVEFFDYQCPYCKSTMDAVENVVKGDGNVRLVLKEFPVLGAASHSAAIAALASVSQGKYPALHDALLRSKGPLDDAAISRIEIAAGVDPAQLQSALADPEMEATVKRNLDLGKAIEVAGTPTFIVGSQVLPGVVTEDALKAAIQTERAKKQQRG